MSRLRLTLLLVCSACAQRVPDLDRTQPNKLQKSIFDGEWYYRQTIAEVPYGAGFTFIGETGRMERVRFEISESYLTAYRTYEYTADSEKPYLVPGTKFQGAPVAQFRISGHFDVQRQYNPATGEQTNVLEENGSDRPWHERRYFRVDWSNNLLSNFDFIAGGIDQSATPYYVNEPTDPDHWFLGQKDASNGEWRDVRDDRTASSLKSADYFDLVTKIFARPRVVDYYGNGSFLVPACWIFGTADCASADIKVRHSFMKVAQTSYEPLDYPDNYPMRNEDGQLIGDASGNIVRVPMFDKFGFFRTERDAFDKDRGLTETGRLYLINRWNLWEATKFDDGLDMPYSQRTVKPIVYYTSPTFPEALKPAAQRLAQDWNAPFAETVAALRNQRTPSEQVFELRDNTYTVGSDGRVSNYGQRIGDLRYSQIYWIDQPLSAAPLGYGPSSSDPLTGEIINANAYLYGASLTTYTQYAKDIVDLLNGTLDPNEFQFGETTAKQVAARVIQKQNSSAVKSLDDLSRHMLTAKMPERLTTLKAIGKDKLLKDPAQITGRMRAIETRPDLLSKLLTSEVLYALRQDNTSNTSPTSDELKKFAPSTWLSRDGLKREQDRIEKLSRNCVYMAEFADDAIVGLARELKGKPSSTVSAQILETIFLGIAEHEVGHTFGLRHNFEGSYDALNFSRAYWNLKGENAVGLDTTQSEAQINGKMRELQYSSVMDYGSRFNSDVHGIGRYDKAAIHFGYGQFVDTFSKGPLRNEHNQRSVLLPLNPDFLRHYINYVNLPKFFGGLDVMDGRTLTPYSKIIGQELNQSGSLTEVPYLFCSDEYAGGTPTCARWDQGADPHEISANAIDSYERYYFFNSFKRDRRYFSPNSYIGRIYSRYLGPMQSMYQQWVYRQFTEAGTWEQLGEIQECFNTHVSPAVDCKHLGSDNFWSSLSSLLSVSPGMGQLKLVGDKDWNKDLNAGAAYAAATIEGLNELFNILETPEPGSYVDLNDFKVTCTPGDTACEEAKPFSNDYRKDNRLSLATSDWTMNACDSGQKSILSSTGSVECAKAVVDTSVGRYPFTNYDGSTGYYYFEKIRWIGSFYDKIAAILTLTDPTTNFVGVDTVSDVRRFAIGWNLLFPDLMHRFFSSIVADDLPDYAPRVKAGARFTRLPFSSISSSTDDLLLGQLPPAIEDLVEPGVPMESANNFTVRIYALLFGMANFTAVFSPEFTDAAQVCVRGSGECTLPDSTTCDEVDPDDLAGPGTASPCWQFTNPTNSKVYTARKSPGAPGPNDPPPLGFKGVGEMMLQKSAVYASNYAKAKVDYQNLYNAGTTDAEEKKKLKDRLDFTASTLQNAVEDLELVRGFYSLFGLIR